MTILIAHVLSVVFIFTSSPPANDHAIPSPTTASTPRRRTILITYRIMLAKTLWNPARPVGTLHLYFLVVIVPHTLSLGSHVFQSALIAQHWQPAPGTFSVVYISVYWDVVVVLIFATSSIAFASGIHTETMVAANGIRNMPTMIALK